MALPTRKFEDPSRRCLRLDTDGDGLLRTVCRDASYDLLDAWYNRTSLAMPQTTYVNELCTQCTGLASRRI